MKKQYEEILTRITADLEKGIIPWEKPWCLRDEGGNFYDDYYEGSPEE